MSLNTIRRKQVVVQVSDLTNPHSLPDDYGDGDVKNVKTLRFYSSS